MPKHPATQPSLFDPPVEPAPTLAPAVPDARVDPEASERERRSYDSLESYLANVLDTY